MCIYGDEGTCHSTTMELYGKDEYDISDTQTHSWLKKNTDYHKPYTSIIISMHAYCFYWDSAHQCSVFRWHVLTLRIRNNWTLA